MTIPLAGNTTSSQIERMEYSKTAKVLMLVTDAGVSMMKV